MAKYFGQKSRHSKFLSFKYTGLFFIALILTGSLAFLLQRIELGSDNTIFSWIIVLFLFLLVGIGPKLAKLYEKQGAKVWRGQLGENEVRKILTTLSDDYNVFEDVVLGQFGNIDFVVIGPTGVFSIEVKSHAGELGFDGYQLLNNGRAFMKNFLNQAWGEKISLQKFFRQSWPGLSVVPILVFTKAHMMFGLKPLRGVHVINKDFLLNLISSTHAVIKDIDQLSEFLKNNSQ